MPTNPELSLSKPIGCHPELFPFLKCQKAPCSCTRNLCAQPQQALLQAGTANAPPLTTSFKHTGEGFALCHKPLAYSAYCWVHPHKEVINCRNNLMDLCSYFQDWTTNKYHISRRRLYFLPFCVSCILDKRMSMTLFRTSLQRLQECFTCNSTSVKVLI